MSSRWFKQVVHTWRKYLDKPLEGSHQSSITHRVSLHGAAAICLWTFLSCQSMTMQQYAIHRRVTGMMTCAVCVLQVHCRSAFTWWHDTVGKSLEYLDNFDIHCSHGEFLRQWRMTWGEMSGKKAIRYVCCRFHYEPDWVRTLESYVTWSHSSFVEVNVIALTRFITVTSFEWHS